MAALRNRQKLPDDVVRDIVSRRIDEIVGTAR
jgi:hypothetical protein